MQPRGGNHLTRTSILLFLLLFAGASTVAAQSTGGPADTSAAISVPAPLDIADPVAHVRNDMSWQFEPFLNWGTGLGNRDTYKFFWGGLEAGKILTPPIKAGIFGGQFEYAVNIMPLWQAYTPPPHYVQITCVTPGGQLTTCPWPYGGGTFHGVSITPVIFRWNFNTHNRRVQPWFQAAGGLIYTTHKFPPNYFSDNNTVPPVDGGTCVFNFSPQGGGGIRIFTRDKRSIDIGVNGVHISSASLGDRNPGVNASVQIQVGYTFWK
jgi:lipid A 3-O-deacylase